MSHFKLIASSLMVSCLLLLTACATPPASTAISEPDWEISGKIGIREPGSRPNTLLFNWQQQQARYVIHLFNSIGQIQLTLSGNGQQATAIQPNGETHIADSPEALLLQLTGWYFPVSSARHWLQGRTDGHEHAIAYNDQALPEQFTALQWHVTLNNYQPVQNKPLPHRIRLQQDQLTLTMIISDHARFTP